MCGIVGVYSIQSPKVSREVMESMLGSLEHRGPDSEGIVEFEQVSLGHRRLSILDLTDSGKQPMSTPDERFWITYNGEVYNYKELRQELEECGYRFRTATDTEVILYAYQQWGKDCVQKFNGMWSFVIWDCHKKELFCARDRFGVKPFHYFYDGKSFVFASEIKALLRYPEIKRQPNHQAIYDFIIYGRVNHTKETFFKGIFQLPAAHYCFVNEHGMSVQRYWDIDEKRTFEGTMEEAAQEFYRLFEDSVRLRFRSDVEVASCLSGGLDSSSIVCVADKLIKIGELETKNRLNTFSLMFDYAEKYNEKKWIDIVCQHTDVDSHFTIPTEQDLLSSLHHLLEVQEEPFGSTSMFGQYMVMKLIHENGIKVTLDGQGSDEMLAGYLAYADSYFADLYQSGNYAELEKQVNIYCAKHNLTPSIAIERAKKLAETGKFGRHIEANAKYLRKDFADTYYKEIELPRKFSTFLQNQLYQDLTATSIPALLRYEDRNSMAFSIESRVPFLDYRLVEFIFSLPAEMKMYDAVTKVILREAMRGVLPEEIRNRQDKMGFVTPELVWFRRGMTSFVDSLLYSNQLIMSDMLDVSAVRKEWERCKNGERQESATIWRFVCLELWLQTFMGGRI